MTIKFRSILWISIILIFNSCAPKLTYTEIKDKINSRYTALNENDIEYEFKNTPVKFIKEYGEEGHRKKLQTIYELRESSEYPIYFDSIGDLKIQDIQKCNSTYFYKVKYLIDKAQMTPYIDSTALALNYKSYGKDNVTFNPNSKILEVRLTKEEILILDKDKVWKLLNYKDFDEQLYNRLFGKEFSQCLKTKVKKSDYLPYW